MRIIYKKNLVLHKSNNVYFEGYANVFNVVDEHQDLILPGAFIDSIHEFKKNNKFPGMYFNHNLSVPLGKWIDMYEDKYGLYVAGKLLFSLPIARSVHALMQKMSLGLSVAIEVIQSSIKDKIRYIHKAKLHEISLTKEPANTHARVFI